MRLSPDEDFGHKVTKVSVRGDCFGGGDRDDTVGAAQAL